MSGSEWYIFFLGAIVGASIQRIVNMVIEITKARS